MELNPRATQGQFVAERTFKWLHVTIPCLGASDGGRAKVYQTNSAGGGRTFKTTSTQRSASAMFGM